MLHNAESVLTSMFVGGHPLVRPQGDTHRDKDRKQGRLGMFFFFSARPKKIDLFSSLNNNFSKHRYSRHISQHNLVQASKLSLKYAHWSRQINTGRIFQTFQIMQDRWRTSEKLSRSCSPCPRHHPLHCSSGVEVSALPVL